MATALVTAEHPNTATASTTAYGASMEKKPPLKIDFESMFASVRDEPPLELVVMPSASASSAAAGGDRFHRLSPANLKKVAANSSPYSSVVTVEDDDVVIMSGRDDSATDRKEASEWDMPAYSASSSFNGALRRHKQMVLPFQPFERTHKQSASSSQPSEKSKFATCFMEKLANDVKQKSEPNTGEQIDRAFASDLSYLNHHSKLRRIPLRDLQQSKRTKPAQCSKQLSSQKPNKLCQNSGKYMSLVGFLVGGASPGSLPLQKEERRAGSITIKEAPEVLNLNGSKNDKDLNLGQTVVMVVEEEPEHTEKKEEVEELSFREASEALRLKDSKHEKDLNVEQTVVLVDEEKPEHSEGEEEIEELSFSPRSGKIYYPSRDDPESLEILHSELKCLERGKFLTSTIMNCYIRFLQDFAPQGSQPSFYFFNTYFYSKLQEAVSCKNIDREAFFIKFRRWWKGVNIFQKTYIFLPINECNHWSLAIICMPDKEEESGPIILHLDSLGLHSSISIFDNIKSLLKSEWEFLCQDDTVLDVPMSDRIWKHLPDKIDQKIITVPRQTNDYDCGLFVLYYMESFIQEAPNRLKQQHLLMMFGKHWFIPEAASSLRWKIKRMLHEEFRKADREDISCVSQSVSSS